MTSRRAGPPPPTCCGGCAPLTRRPKARWWAAARKGDAATLGELLSGGREVLATTVDEKGRTCVRPRARAGAAPARERRPR